MADTFWADALFGAKTAAFVGDDGITVYHVPKERLAALGDPMPLDPQSISPHSDKEQEKFIPYDRLTRVEQDFGGTSLTVVSDGQEQGVPLTKETVPVVFNLLRLKVQALEQSQEPAPVVALVTAPGCGLVFCGILGVPFYLAAKQAAEEKTEKAYTGYRAGRKQAFHDIVKFVGPDATLGIVLTLVVVCLLVLVTRLATRPTITVLRR